MKQVKWGLISICLFFLIGTVGCRKLDSFSREGINPAADALDQIKISLNLSFPALLEGSEPSSQSVASQRNVGWLDGPLFDFNPATDTSFDGKITFHHIASGRNTVYDIRAILDSSWDARLEQTLVLLPGSYDINLLLSGSGQEYLGVANSVMIAGDGTNDIGMTIYPVIGESLITTGITDEVSAFYLNYPANQFIGLTTPTMTVTIDSTNDTTFSLAQFTGSDRLYINYPDLDGTHDIKITLYSAGVAIARYSDTVNFAGGMNLVMNLIPIFGTATFTLTEQGSDATFDFVMPNSVVTALDAEANGTLGDTTADDYYVLLTITGNRNSRIDTVLSWTADGTGDYRGSFIYPTLQYDTLNISMEVWDGDPVEEKIGGCAFTMDVTKDNSSVSCDLTLRKRAAISGQILQVLGVNVIDTSSDQVFNAQIYVDNLFAGNTGGSNVTDGFAYLLLEPGSHSIYATDASGDATSDIENHTFDPTTDSWVDNLLIRLK